MLSHLAAGVTSAAASVANAAGRAATTAGRTLGHTLASSPTGLTPLGLKVQNKADALGQNAVAESADMTTAALEQQATQAEHQMKAMMVGAEMKSALEMFKGLTKMIGNMGKEVANSGPGGN